MTWYLYCTLIVERLIDQHGQNFQFECACAGASIWLDNTKTSVTLE